MLHKITIVFVTFLLFGVRQEAWAKELHITYQSTTAPSTDPNKWMLEETVDSRPLDDGDQPEEGQVVDSYYNYLHVIVHKVVKDYPAATTQPSQTSHYHYQYNSKANLINEYDSSAWYNTYIFSANTDGTFGSNHSTDLEADGAFLSSQGLITHYTYSASGDTTDQLVISKSVRNGTTDSGTEVESYEYYGVGDTPDSGGRDSVVKRMTRYPGPTTSPSEITEYDYPDSWYDGFHPITKVTHVKLDETNELVTSQNFDPLGNLVWEKDPNGTIHYYGWSGTELSMEVHDMNTAVTRSGVFSGVPETPSGFSCTGGDHLNLVTKYEYANDNVGIRYLVKKTDPDGRETYYRRIMWTETNDSPGNYRTFKDVNGSDLVFPRVAELREYQLHLGGGTYSVTGSVRRTFSLCDSNVLSEQIAAVTLANSSTGASDSDYFVTKSRTDYIYNAAGGLAVTRVYPNYSGAVVDTSTAADTSYSYDKRDRVTQITDPDGKSTYSRFGLATLSSGGGTLYFHEARNYPPIINDSGYKLVGPVDVKWTDAQDKLIRTFLAAPTVSGSTPTGTETLSDSTVKSRTDYTYDWRNRQEATRNYFSLSGLSSFAAGTLDTHYYETKRIYDNLDRVIRVSDGMHTITGTVYDTAQRVVTEWKGTSDTSATVTDPSGGSAGGNNMSIIAHTFYDTARDGSGTPVTYATKREFLKASSSIAYTFVNYDYDTAGRLTTTTTDDPDGGGSLVATKLVNTLDDAGRVTSSQTKLASSGTLLAQTDNVYDDRGNLTTTKVYDVTSGTAGNYLKTAYGYDDAGRQAFATRPQGGYTKTEYDAAGRVIRNTFCALASGSPSTQPSSGDGYDNALVLTEGVSTYTLAGDVLHVTNYARAHNAGTLSGLLSNAGTSDFRRTYSATWYDDAHRITCRNDFGTGTSSFSFPSSPYDPNSSDDVIASKTVYDIAGHVNTAIDNRGKQGVRWYDALGRVTELEENYTVGGSPPFSTQGTPTDSANRTTQYTYNADGQIVTQTAHLADSDQVTRYVYSQELTDKGCPVKSNSYLRAIIYPDSDDTVSSSALANGSDSTYDRIEMTYTASGLPYTRKDQRGVELTFTYDPAGRRIDQQVSSGSPQGDKQITYSYTQLGQIEKITSYSTINTTVSNQLKREYNGLGQLTKETANHSGAVDGGSFYTQYVYDTTNSSSVLTKGARLKYTVYPNSAGEFDQVYDGHDGIDDAVSRANKVAAGSGGSPTSTLVEYNLLGDGTMVQKDYATPKIKLDYGVASGYDHLDRFGRILQQEWIDYNAGSGSLSFQDFNIQHAYDRGGNRLYAQHAENTGTSSLVQYYGASQVYSYDDLNRLTKWEQGKFNSGSQTIEKYWETAGQKWTLDALGNQTATMELTDPRNSTEDDRWTTWSQGSFNAANEQTSRVVRGNSTGPVLGDEFSSNTLSQWTVASGTMTVSGGTASFGSGTTTVAVLGESIGPFSAVYNNDYTTASHQLGVTYHFSSLGSYDSWLNTTGSDPQAMTTALGKGKVGLYSDGGGKFDYLRIYDDARSSELNGRWVNPGAYKINDDGRLQVIGFPSTGDYNRGNGKAILVKNLRLQNFRATFSTKRLASTTGGVTFVFSAMDEQHYSGIHVFHKDSSTTPPQAVEAPYDYGNPDIFIGQSDTEDMPTVTSSDLLWTRIANDGSTFTVKCLVAGSAPDDMTWDGAPDLLHDDYDEMPAITPGGMLGFRLADSNCSVGDLSIDYWNGSGWSSSLSESFALDGNGMNDVSPTYDAAGNLTGDGVQAYSYDAWNRLVDVACGGMDVGMQYDGLGRRVIKIVTGTGDRDGTFGSYYDGQRAIYVEDGSGGFVNSMVWGLKYVDELIRISNDAHTSYALQDANWNVIGAVDEDGTLGERYQYTPYGQRTVFINEPYSGDSGCWTPRPIGGTYSHEPTLCIFGHQGLMHDEEIGLIYNRARELHPVLGRFMQRDPLGYVDGISLYGYERLNPAGFRDPSGKLIPQILCGGCLLDTAINITNAIVRCKMLGQASLQRNYNGSRARCVIETFAELERSKNLVSRAATAAACACCGHVVASAVSGAGEDLEHSMSHDDRCAKLEQAWLDALGRGDYQTAEAIKTQAVSENCNGFLNDDQDPAGPDSPDPDVHEPVTVGAGGE